MENERNLNDLKLNENEQADIQDLAVGNDTEIKGGPKKIFIGGLSVTESATPNAVPIPEGPGSGGPVYNHNETVVVDVAEEAATDEADYAETTELNDLNVKDAEQVSGGSAKNRRAEVKVVYD